MAQRKFNQKVCADCGNKYTPVSGLQTHCDDCKEKRRKNQPDEDRILIPDSVPRGVALRGSLLALDIERSVQRRIAKKR